MFGCAILETWLYGSLYSTFGINSVLISLFPLMKSRQCTKCGVGEWHFRHNEKMSPDAIQVCISLILLFLRRMISICPIYFRYTISPLQFNFRRQGLLGCLPQQFETGSILYQHLIVAPTIIERIISIYGKHDCTGYISIQIYILSRERILLFTSNSYGT